MFGLGAQELLIILVIILVLFGAKKVPELARSLGQGAKEIRKGFSEGEDNQAQDKDRPTDAKDEGKQDKV